MSIIDKFVNACWGPKITMPKKEEDEFEKAVAGAITSMLENKATIHRNLIANVAGGSGGGPYAIGIGAGGGGNAAFFNPGPSHQHVRCAQKVLLKLIDQADSIIADPEDLAKRAWAIADEMEKQEKERCK